MSIRDKISKESIDNAKLSRDSALNQSEFSPGMGDDGDLFGGTDDLFGGTDDLFGGDPFGTQNSNEPFGNTIGGDPFGGGLDNNSPFGYGATNQAQTTDFEDKVFDGIVKGGKGFIGFTKEFVGSFKQIDSEVIMNTGRLAMILGGGVALSGVAFSIFGKKGSMDLVVGGLLTSGLAVVMFSSGYEKCKSMGILDMPNSEGVGSELDATFDSTDSWLDQDTDSWLEDDDNTIEDGDFEDTYSDLGEFESDYSYDIEEDDYIEEDYSIEPEITVSVTKEDMMSEIIANINTNNPNGLMTRSYLYDTVYPCLDNIDRGFSNIREIVEGSIDFDAWDAVLQESAELLRPSGKEDDLLYLISAKEKLFYILLEVKRPKWLKSSSMIDSLVKEVVNIYSFDKHSCKRDEKIYGMGEAVGNSIYIKIMKGSTAMVSLKDILEKEGEVIKDTKNFLPIILGVDTEGNILWEDFKPIDSLLVTGMPRSGKSWFVQALLTQMCMWLKPSELNFYILDPKGLTSDFRSFKLPHVKKFVSDDNKILQELRNVVKVEAKRRTELLGKEGCVNIWDFKKKCPDVEIPLIYVMVDEVITLAERMTKEDKEEFNSLLLELVSRLPNLGIRLIMIPHVVKDQVIKKSITDIIPCRISVKGDADHIEKSTGDKKFPHKLIHVGDMAVKIGNKPAQFVHSVVLSDSNDKNDALFDFLRKMWCSLEPESVKGSMADDEVHNRSERVYREPRIAPMSFMPKVRDTEVVTPKNTNPIMDDLLKGVHDTVNSGNYLEEDEDGGSYF